ncbi:hypothetical protein BASA81_007979 [Batrachochytrium salamandrivorans]|nr:hypothetical protein BASA81_007979 [Batrachochytrium salamandrivorans]
MLAPSSASSPRSSTTTRGDYRNLNVGLLPGSLFPRPKQALFSLTYLSMKVSVSVFVQRLSFVTRQIKEMEDELVNSEEEIDLWDIFSPNRTRHEWNVWQGFAQRAKLGVVFEVCVQSFYLLEQAVVANLCSPETFHRLFKSIPESAIRKSASAGFRGWSQPMLAYKVFHTAFRGQVMYWTALFVVSVVFDLANVLPQSLSPATPPPPGKATATGSSAVTVSRARRNTMQSRVYALAVKCLMGCGLAAVGAAVGTLIKPGFGTSTGMFVLSSFK